LKTIDASIVEKYDGIYMQKSCVEHGLFESFIESDKTFYKKHMNRKYNLCNVSTVIVPITNRCDLNCNYCFFPDREIEDASLETIKLRIRESMKFNSEWITLSGGEPTLRDDLFDIIDFIHSEYSGVMVSLLTNGIRLSDINYVRKLKRHIDYVIFSFNGTCDDIYKKINNINLARIKYQALDNLREESIETILSPTILRDVNDKDMKNILSFAFDNLSFVCGIRMRGMANVGYHSVIDEPMTQSELVQIVVNSFDGENRAKMSKIVNKFSPMFCYHSTNYFSIVLFVDKTTKKIISWSYGRFNKNSLWFVLKEMRSLIVAALYLLTKKQFKSIAQLVKLKLGSFCRSSSYTERVRRNKIALDLMNLHLFTIDIFYWFDKENIDLIETKSSGIMHAMNDNRVLDFFEVVL
jgi:wyosine [tRNA(Phe)-imidazoG37] synthetase (radical SAM superfamily)